ncbi:hypothetical protein PsorP6_010400 [Peronosclerospora sorghi]|uniref:Uncharacterized protein n=1 Tax=Peronosclerospora sorghi TaxID=230839 RepID=A0ACC0VTT7_9STRA|nr:hypothetical protein PsorP6_010400 [Peronosclerospora sorghi]
MADNGMMDRGVVHVRSPLSLTALEPTGLNPPPTTRPPKLAVSLDELTRRVSNVHITTDFSNVLANVSLHGWTWKRDTRTFSIFSRPGRDSHGAAVVDAQVLAMGTVAGARALERLVALLRTTSENAYNQVMRQLYPRDFIYGALVAATTSLGDGTRLSVKTCAFARTTHRFAHTKNHHLCLVEHFRPTKHGFAIVFLSVPPTEVLVGKATGKDVHEVCPARGWLLVEKAPETRASVRILYHAGIQPEFLHANDAAGHWGYCSLETTAARLVQLATGICRLGEVLHHQRAKDSARGLLKARRHRSSTTTTEQCTTTDVASTHCVACTSKFDWWRRRRRCGLCTYPACTKCIYREPMIIYDRYAATIQFCARCRECMVGGDYPHLRLATGRPHPGVEATATSATASR